MGTVFHPTFTKTGGLPVSGQVSSLCTERKQLSGGVGSVVRYIAVEQHELKTIGPRDWEETVSFHHLESRPDIQAISKGKREYKWL